jgi:type IV fimbrial biogenesis protein FimT
VSIRSSSSGADFAPGWDVFTDANGDGAKASSVTATDGTVLRTQAKAASMTITRVTRSGSAGSYTYAPSTASDKMYLVFNARGTTGAGGTSFFRICDGRDSTTKGRVVEVSAIGRVGVSDANASCSAS